MPEQTKTLAGILQVLEVKEDRLKLQIGNVKPTAWAKSCTTAFDEIKALAGKDVIADYEEGANKQFPNNPYKNVIKVVENAEPVASTVNTPSPDNSMTKNDWLAKETRIAICTAMQAFINAGYFPTPDTAMDWYEARVAGKPPTAPTKPQEGKQATPKDADPNIGTMMDKVYTHWKAKKIEHNDAKIKEWVGGLVPGFTGLGMIKDKALMKKLYDKAMSESLGF